MSVPAANAAPIAAQHKQAYFRVALAFVDRGGQAVVHLPGERVAPARAVKGHGQHPAIASS